MDFRHSRCLRGPNRWAGCPVLEAALDFSDAALFRPEIRIELHREHSGRDEQHDAGNSSGFRAE